MPKETLKKCDHCGKEYAAKNWKQRFCCKECQVTYYRQDNYASLKVEAKSLQKRKSKIAHSSIAEIALEAQNHGMSYGKYLAMIAEKER